jgi:hypothetical protein
MLKKKKKEEEKERRNSFCTLGINKNFLSISDPQGTLPGNNQCLLVHGYPYRNNLFAHLFLCTVGHIAFFPLCGHLSI